jgi:hypothetical protein
LQKQLTKTIMEKKINLTSFSKTAFLQLIKGDVKINKVIYDAENWQEVLNYINTMNIEYTQEQIEWTKRKLWND